MDIPVQEQRYQAQGDARTLAEAKLIRGDQKRLMAATAESKQMDAEKAKEAQSFNSLSKEMYPSMQEGGDS